MSATTTSKGEPGRPAGPTAKGASTRRHIIDAAAALFADVGYDRARMSDLVAAAGMTKGAVYFHFDSKESPAVAVLEAKNHAWICAVEHRLEAVPSGRARLAALLPAMLALHREDPSTWAISKLARNLTELNTSRPHATALTERWIDVIAALVRDSQSHGDTRDGIDPTTAAVALVGAFDGLNAFHDTVTRGGDEPFTAASELLNAMVLAYLLPAT